MNSFKGNKKEPFKVYFSLNIHHLSNSTDGQHELSFEGKTKLQPPDQKASAFASPSDNFQD
jgi:hypothetical protein